MSYYSSVADRKSYALDAIFRAYPGYTSNAHSAKRCGHCLALAKNWIDLKIAHIKFVYITMPNNIIYMNAHHTTQYLIILQSKNFQKQVQNSYTLPRPHRENVVHRL